MVKKTITYKDFDGQERTEDYYFNLTKTELTEMELSMNGGLSTLLEKIIKEKDMKQLIEYFKRIVLDSYGEKSLDGRMFIKNDKLKEELEQLKAKKARAGQLAINNYIAILDDYKASIRTIPDIQETYNIMAEYSIENKYDIIGSPKEIYIKNKYEVDNEDDMVTEIQLPVIKMG